MLSQAKRSVFWSGIQQVSVFGLQFVISLIIASLISPSDYGVVALTVTFFAIAQIVLSLGVEGALIQKKECSSADYDTAFMVCAITGIIFYAIFYLAAGGLAAYFDIPQLEMVIKISATVLIFKAFSTVPYAKLQRDLKFRLLARISASVTLLSGIVAIVLAYMGFAYWALVVQTMLSAFALALLYFSGSGWRPGFGFSVESFRNLMKFGIPMMMSLLIRSVYDNLYSLVTGKRFGQARLGIFNRGTAFAGIIPTNLSDFTMRALFPIFSRYQDNLPLLRSQACRTMHLTAFVAVPLNLFIALNCNDLIRAILGAGWLEMVPVIRMMSLAYLSYLVCNVQINLLKVVNRTDRLFWCEVVKMAIGLGILIFTVRLGFMAMIYGLLAYNVLSMVIGGVFTYFSAGLNMMDYLKSLLPVAVVAVAAVLAGYWAASFAGNIYARLCLSGIMSGALFLAVSYIFKDEAIGFFLGFLKRK